MNTFFVSDTHFGHSKVILYSSRPYQDAEEMNESMIQEWNKVVKHDDEVYHLGDFAFMKPAPLMALCHRLHGNKHLILGNHDKWIIENWNKLLKQGVFDSIQSYKELKISGTPMIVLFHYGMRVWNRSHHSSIHLYGHSHGSLPPFGKSVDVGVDCKEITSEYRPIHLDEVLAYMKNREFVPVDHHDGDRD